MLILTIDSTRPTPLSMSKLTTEYLNSYMICSKYFIFQNISTKLEALVLLKEHNNGIFLGFLDLLGLLHISQCKA